MGLDQLHAGCKWLQKQNYFTLWQHGWLFLSSKLEQFVPDSGGHAIGVAAAILIGFGVKLFFFPAPIAEADASGVKSSSMNVLQMHQKGLPVQKGNDMSFVFSDD